MASISIETKLIKDLPQAAVGSGDDLLVIRMADGTGTKSLPISALEEWISTSSETGSVVTQLADLILGTGAGNHNSVYRGKYLGDAFTSAQSETIRAGGFDELYIGDYWTINDVNWRIAAFDYYLGCGDTETTDHHIVVVPDTVLYAAQMNSSDTTSGGYVGSEMYTTNLATAKTTVENAFGSEHIFKHQLLLTNAVSSSYASGWAWSDEWIALPSETQVFGTRNNGGNTNGTRMYGYNTGCDKNQFPLFAMRHDLIPAKGSSGSRQTWWLRDVATSADFAYVGSYGQAGAGASDSRGVRPASTIY